MSLTRPDKPAATLWLDTEFNGFGGALISMALVDEVGASVYFALPCDNPVPWVAEHVMPVLGIVGAGVNPRLFAGEDAVFCECRA